MNIYLFLKLLIVAAIAGILLNIRPYHIPFYCRSHIQETRPGCPLG